MVNPAPHTGTFIGHKGRADTNPIDGRKTYKISATENSLKEPYSALEVSERGGPTVGRRKCFSGGGGKMLKMGPEQGLRVKRRGKTPVWWLMLVILEICGSRKAMNLKDIWAIL